MNLLQKLFQKSATWTAVIGDTAKLGLVFATMVGLATTAMFSNVISVALPTGCVQMELAFAQMDGMESTARWKVVLEIATGTVHAPCQLIKWPGNACARLGGTAQDVT